MPHSADRESSPAAPPSRASVAKSAKSVAEKLSKPLLIYDDMCSSCTKFAKTAAKLSRGWIEIAGHYKSIEAINIKKAVFPCNFDPTKMFWLINKKGAFGARAGLIQASKEVIIGNLKWFGNICRRKNTLKDKSPTTESLLNDKETSQIQCNYSDKATCMSTKTTLNRLFCMLKNSATFKF